jgi:5'-methylthioadenosine phosphorylase
MRKAIIGGTGVYDLKGLGAGAGAGLGLGASQQREITTEYGVVSVDIVSFNLDNDAKESSRNNDSDRSNADDCQNCSTGKIDSGSIEVVFLARHGKGHGVPPHKINYRANIMALKQLEVDEIFATCAVGSLNESFPVGSLVLLKDFIDFTKGREETYYAGNGGVVAHVVMDEPYCNDLSKALLQAAEEYRVQIVGEAVYVCTQGPRFESAAEIRMFGKIGGDVVGMTNVPECVLAKELGICYSAVGIVSNWCTGFKKDQISMHDIETAMAKNKTTITELFIKVLLEKNRQKRCKCSDSLIVL